MEISNYCKCLNLDHIPSYTNVSKMNYFSIFNLFFVAKYWLTSFPSSTPGPKIYFIWVIFIYLFLHNFYISIIEILWVKSTRPYPKVNFRFAMPKIIGAKWLFSLGNILGTTVAFCVFFCQIFEKIRLKTLLNPEMWSNCYGFL